LVAHLVPPFWRAGGLPYLLGYGKNVEHAAVGAALLAAAASSWLLGGKRAGRPLAFIAILGFASLAVNADLRGLLVAGPQLLLAFLLFAASRAGSRSAALAFEPTGPAAPERDLTAAATSALLVGLAVLAFVLSLRPLDIDVYHHGEVLASALDLLRGGRPFETFLWPHGVHDTGLTALFMRATGKIGTSPIALAQATCRALGVVAAFALAIRLTGSRALALATSAGLVLALVLHGTDAPGPAAALHQLGVLVFVVLGFVSFRGPWSQVGVGALFGLAYLFRVETAVYAAVATLGVVAATVLQPPTVSRGEAWRSFARILARLGAGASAVLLACRLWLGWPGVAWFTFTLRDLPRYHGDAAKGGTR
jgi:hypothetical protein